MREPHFPISTAPDARLHLPSADEDLAFEVLEHLSAMLDDLPEDEDDTFWDAEPVPTDRFGFITHCEAFVIVVPMIEACIDDDPREVEPPLVAQFAMIAGYPSLPESIALQIAFGRSVGDEQVREMARLLSRAQQRGVSVDEYVAELVEIDAVPRGQLVRLFHGETRRAPDQGRIARGIVLLRTIASLVPDFIRPPLLCAIAWLHWAQGKRAHAMAYLAEALRIDPENVLAFGLEWLIATKTPRWVAR